MRPTDPVEGPSPDPERPDAAKPDPERTGPASDPEGPGPGRRPRLVAAELSRSPGSRLRVRVVLEYGDRELAAEREGVGQEIMVLRLAAEATLAALGRATGRERHFALVGIKEVHAFDTRVILVCIRPADDRVRRVLGSVPVEGKLVEAVGRSVLDATNRLVEGFRGPS